MFTIDEDRGTELTMQILLAAETGAVQRGFLFGLFPKLRLGLVREDCLPESICDVEVEKS